MSTFTRNFMTYFSESDIDGTTTGVHDLTTTQNSGRPFNPQLSQVSIQSQSNVLTGCAFSVGTNSPNYDNIVSSQSAGGSGGNMGNVRQDAAEVAPNTLIKVNVITACTAVPLTTPTLNFQVQLTGFDDNF